MSLILVSSLMIAGAVSIAVYLFAAGRNTASAGDLAPGMALGGIPEGPRNLHEALLQRSRSERVVKPWLKKLNSMFERTTPTNKIDDLYQLSVTAGIASSWTARRITISRMVCTAAGVIFGWMLFTRLGGITGALVGVIVAGMGWRALDVYLTNRARLRQETITRELPDVADQVAISVQAGLSFEQAIRRTVNSTTGPLSDELARFLHDVRLGQARSKAFKAMQDRVDVQDVTSFVRAISQAEKTGVSIADILQIQSDELRERRKQRAEERAMKLPVLMLLPLVTCVLPPLLIVLIGPAVIKVMESGF